MTDKVLVGSIWKHADGGLYRVLDNKGVMKIGHSEWLNCIRYDHADGTMSNGPYTTDVERWFQRFSPYGEAI